MALATSVASARVGRGLWIMESSIWVAVITVLFWSWHLRMILFCTRGISSVGSCTPRSPRATMMPSATRMIMSMFSTPSRSSILAMMCIRDPSARRIWRISRMSSGLRTNEAATKSMSFFTAKRRFSTSFSVTAGRRLLMPMMFTFLWELRVPPVRTRQRISCPRTSNHFQVDQSVGNQDVQAGDRLVRQFAVGEADAVLRAGSAVHRDDHLARPRRAPPFRRPGPRRCGPRVP